MFGENKSCWANHRRQCWKRNVIQGNSQWIQIVFIKDVTGAIHMCTSKAFFVPGLHHDLLAQAGRKPWRALVTANYRVILDKDPRVSGIFSVTDGEIDPTTGLPFLDLEVFFFVETVPLSETQFENMLGYPLWRLRLGHCPIQTIWDFIPHAKGIEELYRESSDENQQCPACMIGKGHHKIKQRSRQHAKRPLEWVYMDIMS